MGGRDSTLLSFPPPKILIIVFSLDRSAVQVRRRELARRRGPARCVCNRMFARTHIIYMYIAFSEQSWGGKAPPNVMLGGHLPPCPPCSAAPGIEASCILIYMENHVRSTLAINRPKKYRHGEQTLTTQYYNAQC